MRLKLCSMILKACALFFDAFEEFEYGIAFRTTFVRKFMLLENVGNLLSDKLKGVSDYMLEACSDFTLGLLFLFFW